MGVVTPIGAFVTKDGVALARLHRWRSAQARAEAVPDEARISPRVVFLGVIIVSLAVWFGLLELFLLVTGLSLFS